MIEVRLSWFHALIYWLYWGQEIEVEPGIFESAPRRFAFLIRPLWRLITP